jgi:hypothetical protein
MNRGANQTSADAFIVGRTDRGDRASLIEWKYCEEYLNPEDKGIGPSRVRGGRATRRAYQAKTSSFNGVAPLDEFFFEPYYQIMRTRLLADKIVEEGLTPTMPILDARVLVVCPKDNAEYRQVVRTVPLSQRLPSFKLVEELIKATLKDAGGFQVTSQELLTATIRSAGLDVLASWCGYHRDRYDW